MSKENLTIFNGAEHYQKFLESLSKTVRVDYDLKSTKLSKSLYYDLWKIQEAAWQYTIKNNRSDRHPISEIAQDLIAYYLRATLPENYSVRLEVKGKYKTEDKKKLLYVDIAIYKGENPHFIIEVKTNLGFQRSTIEQNEAEISHVELRRTKISEAFGVDKSKIIYVILSDCNVSKDFSSNFWNDKEGKSYLVGSERRGNSPYNFIFPLFHHCDPRYFKYAKKIDKKIAAQLSTDENIMEFAEKNIVTPLEHIIELIQNS